MTKNSLGSDATGKKYSRKDFLKLLGLGGAGIALSSSAVYALAQNLSNNNLNGEKNNHPNEDSDKSLDNQNIYNGEHATEAHEAQEHSNSQILLDHAATGLFLGHILPQFMKNNPAGALKAGLAGVASWYTLSGEEARHHFDEEMVDAAKGVAMMIAVLQATESIQVNYKDVMYKYLERTQDTIISHILEDDHIQELLDGMNIRIIKDLQYPISVRGDEVSSKSDENNGDAYVDYNHIAISLGKFSELLPLLVTNIDHFKNAILRSVAHEDYNRIAKELLDKNGPTDPSLVSSIAAIKDDVLLNEKELIKGRIAFLSQFILLTQVPLFGVGQAGILKNEIKSISTSVKNLFKSAGYLEVDALDFAAQVEAKLTSFLFNRFAYASDIGPMTASLQIGSKYGNSIKGLSHLVLGMLPVVATNIKPLFDELDIIFANVVPNQGKSFMDMIQSIPSDMSEFIQGTYSNIGDTIGALNKSKFTRFGNQAFLNNFVIGKEMEKIDPHMDLPCLYQDSKNNLKNIRKLFDDFPKWSLISKDPLSIDIGGYEFGLYGILFYMERLVSSSEYAQYTEIQKRKTNERIRKILFHPSFDFTRVQKALHFLEKDSGSAKRLSQFLSQYLPNIDYTRVDHDDLYDKVTESRMSDPHRASYDAGLDWSIVSLSDHLYASDKALIATMRKNIAYIRYLENTAHLQLFNDSLRIFLSNMSRHQDRVKKLLPQLSALLSVDEIAYWNTNFGPHFALKGVVDTQDSSDISTKYNIPREWYDKLTKIMGYTDHMLEEIFHRCEKKIGVNSWEVILMVLLIQSPFVTAVVSTVNHWLEKMPKDMNPLIKKHIIGLITYFLSMFADNYVGEVVGHKLIMDNFPDMDPFDALQFVGPLAVVGGSQVITGNSPNAVIGTIQKMYGSSFNKNGKEKDLLESPEWKKWSLFSLEVIFDAVSVGTLASDPLSVEGGLSALAQTFRPKIFG